MSSSKVLEVLARGSLETDAGELHADRIHSTEWMRGVAARSVTPDDGEAAPEPRCQVDHVHVDHRVHTVLAFRLRFGSRFKPVEPGKKCRC